MKILMITPYVTINSRPEFSRNKTGFGYMVMDIARSVAKLAQVEVLASDSRGDAFVKDSVYFLKRSFELIGLNLIHCLSPRLIYQLWCQYHMKRGTFIRLFYHWLLTGYYSQVIKTKHYDVVHIHGCNFATELWMQVCKRYGQKFVVTLHGLNSFSETVGLEPAGKRYERDFLQRVVQGDFPITVISTGMKRTIEKTYNIQNCSNITVVCNSFSFSSNKKKFDIRKLYQLDSKAKIVLYVGNICRRKNQSQLIAAFNLLPHEVVKNTYILFLGGEIEPEYKISEQSKGSKYEKNFIFCGIIDKELVSQYYIQSDAVVLMSLSEGFGLSLIEGMHFGLPVMSFADIDAFADIYNSIAMIGVTHHSDDAVAKGLKQLLITQWDRNKIKDYSRKFESITMAQNYIEVYKNKLVNKIE